MIAFLIPLAALAEDNPWVPAFSAFGGVLTQKVDATATSNATGRQAQGDAEITYPLVGFSAELMTPHLPVPGRPALFLHGDVALSFSSAYYPATEGSPGNPGFYEVAVDVGYPPEQFKPQDLNGTGTQVGAEPESLEISAGVGIAFEMKLWDRTLRLRPSFEYRREQISYEFVLSNGVTYNPPICGATPDESLFLNGCGLASLSAGAKKTFHSIGPGFEVEMDTARTGPLMLSLYVSAQAYRVLGSRNATIEMSGAYDPPPPEGSPANGTINATATIEHEPWNYRGLVGLRFRWLPE